MTIQHILVAHDFSDAAEKALGLALDLAGKLQARVTILNAYEMPAYVSPESIVATANLEGYIRGAAEEGLAAVAERARRPGVAVEITLRQGAAWSEIDAFAKSAHCDLIVMGTHGRRGLPRVLLGSVAERVIRTAPCPVLTVPRARS